MPFALLPSLSPLTNFNPLSLDASRVVPRGIWEMADYLYARFGLPIYVTENNGQHVPKDDIDSEIRYLVENLSWLAFAAKQGVDVRGYFYWALMDNYEWNHGSQIRLGLYRVEPDDPAKTRHARATVPVYAAIAEAGAVPGELAEKYPIDW